MQLQRLLFLIPCVFLVLAGCAHAPVTEELTPYQGAPVTQVQDVTFDGDTFTLPDGTTIAKGAVKLVDFRTAEAEEAGAEMRREEGRSELT